MDSYEFAEWMADYHIEAWDQNDWTRAALICREIVNHSWSPPKTAAQIKDFMPKPIEEAKRAGYQHPVEMKANWARAMANWPKPKNRKTKDSRKGRP